MLTIVIVACLTLVCADASAAPRSPTGARRVPARAASKRCGVASDEAIFEAPGVQVYVGKITFNKRFHAPEKAVIACVLPARTSRVVLKAIEPASGLAIGGLFGGRYLLTSFTSSGETGISVEERFLDLQTGVQFNEFPGGEQVASSATLAPLSTVVAPGEFVNFEVAGSGLIARFTANKQRTTLDTGEKIHALAASEHEIYWLNGSTVKSANVPAAASTASSAALLRGTLALGAAGARDGVAGIAAGARRTKRNAAKRRCEAPGTKTLYRANSSLRVLQERGGQIFGCSDAVGKLFALNTVLPRVSPTGAPTKIELAHEPPIGAGVTLSYQFPAQSTGGAATALIVANPSTGAVIRSALAPANVTDWTYGPQGMNSGVIAYTDGSTLTLVDATSTQQLDTGTISDLAISPASPVGHEPASVFAETHAEPAPFELYWTNSGAPKADPVKVKTG
jgi:hypothetical protein